MKALTVRQPYAGLIASGRKRVETRSWPTNHRGWLLVHAASSTADPWPEAMLARFALQREQWPLGVALAIVRVVTVVPASLFAEHSLPGWGWHVEHEHCAVGEHERAAGDFGVGRWAWLLDDVVRVGELRPLRGRPGLWDVSAQGLGIAPPVLA